jgi:hypothetical protein
MNKAIEIEYNSAKEPIAYPEYGRYIHELLEHACAIEHDGHRQKTVEAIVHMMQLLNPNTRGVEDYKERLWNHAFAMSGYKLNVQAPRGITITQEGERTGPEPIPYPEPNTKFRHYGASIQKMIEKAIEMPDGPKKEGLVEVTASYMKLAYKTWSKEHYVSDDIVKEDLVLISDGQLELHEGHNSLDTLSNNAHKQGNKEKNINISPRTTKAKKTNNNSNNKKKAPSSSSKNSGGGNYRRKR